MTLTYNIVTGQKASRTFDITVCGNEVLSSTGSSVQYKTTGTDLFTTITQATYRAWFSLTIPPTTCHSLCTVMTYDLCVDAACSSSYSSSNVFFDTGAAADADGFFPLKVNWPLAGIPYHTFYIRATTKGNVKSSYPITYECCGYEEVTASTSPI